MRYLLLVLILVGCDATPLPAAGPAKEVDPPVDYEIRQMKGYTVLLHHDVTLRPRDRHQRWPIDVLEQELDDLNRAVGQKLKTVLQQVPVWVNWDAIDPKAPNTVAVYFGVTGKAPERLGRNPLKANGIEILSLKRLGELRPPGSKFQQVITLHEMAHAVHHRVLGFDGPETKAAYQLAVDRKLYDHVADRFGQLGRAYARTNHAEYFAELSCAYLDTCHQYPFNYSDLKSYDPAGFALVESVWKSPEKYADRKIVVEAPKFRGAAAFAATAAQTSPATERDAYMLLGRARGLANSGDKTSAREVLDDLIRKYPTTIAAGDARKLREQMQ